MTFLSVDELTDEELIQAGLMRMKYLPGVEGHRHDTDEDGCTLCGLQWRVIVVERQCTD